MSVPVWVVATWRERGMCEACGAPAVSVWPRGTGALVCAPHLAARVAAARG
jgi:hypothetical protein